MKSIMAESETKTHTTLERTRFLMLYDIAKKSH